MLTMLTAGISLYALYVATEAKSIADSNEDRLKECIDLIKYCIKVIKRDVIKEKIDE
jgi:hypothetical protein